MTKTVFVGLSGGVDSAVSAHLLKQEGYRVVGAFIKGWEPDFLPCTGAEDRLSAMRVAAHLQIPFVTYDLSKEYKQFVVDHFVSEYESGRTPNPDVMCNRTIKFGAFWKLAKKSGADFIATGHYADTNGQVLRTAKDKEKDQTYFLWTLTKSDLAHTLFPLGKLKKPEVRKIAKKIGLPNAARPDSQGLCFLGHVDMREFLKRYVPAKTGDVVNTEGEKLGEHDGAWFYTIGEHVRVAAGRRMFVVGKDTERNEIVASDVRHPMSYGHRMSIDLRNASWVGEPPQGAVFFQYRYHGPLVEGVLEGGTVHLREPILVAPGQSLVAYDRAGTLCLGGGTIE